MSKSNIYKKIKSIGHFKKFSHLHVNIGNNKNNKILLVIHFAMDVHTQVITPMCINTNKTTKI